jgi:hypothetical protein
VRNKVVLLNTVVMSVTNQSVHIVMSLTTNQSVHVVMSVTNQSLSL